MKKWIWLLPVLGLLCGMLLAVVTYPGAEVEEPSSTVTTVPSETGSSGDTKVPAEEITNPSVTVPRVPVPDFSVPDQTPPDILPPTPVEPDKEIM